MFFPASGRAGNISIAHLPHNAVEIFNVALKLEVSVLYGKPDGRAQKIVISDRFISNDPRNCNLVINNIYKPLA
jgi:hypothetical protein